MFHDYDCCHLRKLFNHRHHHPRKLHQLHCHCYHLLKLFPMFHSHHCYHLRKLLHQFHCHCHHLLKKLHQFHCRCHHNLLKLLSIFHNHRCCHLRKLHHHFHRHRHPKNFFFSSTTTSQKFISATISTRIR